MLAPETYTERAHEVLRMLEGEKDAEVAASLRRIAEAWLKLAEDAAREIGGQGRD